MSTDKPRGSDAARDRQVSALKGRANHGAGRGFEVDRDGFAEARTCHDHLAGRLGVALFDALVARRALRGSVAPGEPVGLGPEAREVFGAMGLDLDTLRRGRRRFATACLDQTERRPHLAGALGAAVCAALLERGWVVRQPDGRALVVTDAGRQGLQDELGIRLGEESSSVRAGVPVGPPARDHESASVGAGGDAGPRRGRHQPAPTEQVAP